MNIKNKTTIKCENNIYNEKYIYVKTLRIAEKQLHWSFFFFVRNAEKCILKGVDYNNL